MWPKNAREVADSFKLELFLSFELTIFVINILVATIMKTTKEYLQLLQAYNYNLRFDMEFLASESLVPWLVENSKKGVM